MVYTAREFAQKIKGFVIEARALYKFGEFHEPFLPILQPQ